MARLLDSIPNLPNKLPLIISQKEIVLPGCMKELDIEDEKMIKLLHSKSKSKPDSPFFVGLAQSAKVGTIGTAVTLHFINALGREYMTLVGICRIRIQKLLSEEPYVAEIVQLDYHKDFKALDSDPNIQSIVKDIRDLITSAFGGYRSSFISQTLDKIPAGYLAEIISQLLNFTFEEQCKILNTVDVAERLRATLFIISSKKIMNMKRGRVIASALPMTLQNTEYKKLETRISALDLPPNVESIVQNELKELSMITPINPQHNILHTHLNLVADLPWNKYVEETLNLQKTKLDLEVDHYGLEKVKQRILEYLAVRKLRNNVEKSNQGPILCLVGPPGVGKTSIARSIASTLNRPFERVSLGGVNNISDIRGHRRAYIGAMPGRIIQALKRCGVKNPVILLDEIDKMSNGIQGDPSAALLEVLDPTQNKEFLDHYLNIPFDLSQILFIATANTVQKFSSALFDRLEIIPISGYTYLEKLQIAKKYLLPKQFNESGLNPEKISIPDETLQMIINSYTHEAGVRSLERKIGSLCRSVALKIALNVDNTMNFPIVIDVSAAKEILGPMRREGSKWAGRLGKPGIAVGLIVNSSGGDTAVVESILMPGRGKLLLTGSLGDVMKESAHLAWGWVRSNAHMYGVVLDAKRLNSIDIHIHFPEGAVRKEGPSAGITIATSLMSLFLDRPLLTNIAMTGEISLQGVVLPVGGIKSKVIAAHKDGFTKVIIPQENKKDLGDIPSSVKDDLTFVLAANMHTIIETVFENGDNLLVPQYAKSKL